MTAPWVDRTAVTLDIDWAPDYAIDHAAELLIRHKVAATWFVTHGSPAVERLRARPDLFELGIHPNFLPGSTHGVTPESVLTHCMELVPEARSMRTHGLVQSSRLLALVRATTPIAVDASLFLPHHPWLAPIDYPLESGSLVRLPYGWEDDAEMYRDEPDWDAAGAAETAGGVAVFCFHPIHLFLNSADMTAYRRVGVEADQQRAVALRNPGNGAGRAFCGLLEGLVAAGASGRTVSQLAAAAPRPQARR